MRGRCASAGRGSGCAHIAPGRGTDGRPTSEEVVAQNVPDLQTMHLDETQSRSTFPTPSYKFVFAFVFISVATTDDLCPSICEQIQLAWFNDCPDLLGFCSLSKTEAREEMAHFGAFGLI